MTRGKCEILYDCVALGENTFCPQEAGTFPGFRSLNSYFFFIFAYYLRQDSILQQ